MFELKENFMMTIAAPRGSGKSFFIGTLLDTPKFVRRFDNIVIMSCSVNLNDDYERFIDHPKFTLFEDINENLLLELFDKHETCQKHVVNERRIKRRKLVCPKTLIILDDCIDSGVLNFRGVVDQLAERGRHVKLSVIVSSQRISAVSRSVRINSDYFIIFSPFSVAELDQFSDQFVSRNRRAAFREQVASVFDEEYKFVMLDNTEKQITKKLKVSSAQDFVKGQVDLLN
jgi:hypothetical protein